MNETTTILPRPLTAEEDNAMSLGLTEAKIARMPRRELDLYHPDLQHGVIYFPWQDKPYILEICDTPDEAATAAWKATASFHRSNPNGYGCYWHPYASRKHYDEGDVISRDRAESITVD